MFVQSSLGDYEYITEQRSIPLIVSDAKRERFLGVDTENSGGLDILEDLKLLLFQIEVGGKAYVIDARKVDISPFKEVLENEKYTKVVQYVVYDYKILSVLRDIYLNGIYDTQIAECLLDAGVSRDGHSLDALSLRYLDFRMNKATAKQFIDFPYDGDFTDEQLLYAANDVLVLPSIRKRQQIYLNQLGLNGIAEIEFSLAVPTAKMEMAGIKIDADKWRNSLGDLHKKIFKISNDLRQTLPDPPIPPPKPVRLKKDGTPYANTAKPKPPPVLNLDSPQQLYVACKEAGIDFNKANKITKAGLTNSNTMKFAAKMYYAEPEKANIIREIIKYRELRQTEKTFGENLLSFIKCDGRIHASFKQNGTASGRFSSETPNLQNIQKKGEEGKILRSCFVPEIGHKFVLADYSQIELRIVAELSGDEKMIQILNDPRGDIHSGTAAEMYGVSYENVSSDLRRAAKTINFGLIYGMSSKTLGERLECSPSEANEHLTKYWKTYPTLMAWLEKFGTEAFNQGYSKTIGGRIRWFPTLSPKSEDYDKKKRFYERVGRNHPVQGTSADMTKVAMVCLDRVLDKYLARIVNTVHDELCVEVPFNSAVDVAKLVKSKMIFAGERFLKKVPVLVDVKIRDCWFKDDGVDDDENGQQLWLL